MAQGSKSLATREKLLKLAAETDSVARNIARGPSGVVIRDRQTLESKKNHPLQHYKQKRTGTFGAPRDLRSHDPFGNREAPGPATLRRGWLAAILASARACLRALGL